MALLEKELTSFVQNLEIADAPRSLVSLTPKISMLAQLDDADPSKPSAAVDAGSLVAFTANVSSQHRSDALNSTLLAQLHADKVANRFDKTQIMNWYQAYIEVLTQIGWPAQQFQFQNYTASGSTFSIDTAITSIVSSFLTAPEAAVVKAALDALNNLSSGDPWYTVWDQSSHSADGGNFQVATCTDASGEKTA